MDAAASNTLTPENARASLSLGEVPTWVSLGAFDANYKSAESSPVTHLLVDRQVNAEAHQTYLHLVLRLETMQAVQHCAQWKLPFDPRSQTVVLHSLKVRRGQQEFDQARIESFHFLQREQGLEGLKLDGWFTALLVLEDIRPGDILDYSYTIETRPVLMARYCTDLFVVPRESPVARFSFTVLADTVRPLAWKSSTAELKPAEDLSSNQRRWVWSGQSVTVSPLEENMPLWHLDCQWIQVSDCPDWKMVGQEVAEAWPKCAEAIDALVQEIKRAETETLEQVEAALRLVQDHHRYLSLNIELGGQIPSAPAVVARRRFGDCKDLSFLLVHLLRGLGLLARPILVSTKFDNILRKMLPSANLFDHVIVEFQYDGKVQWVDPTIKYQGGGPLHRVLWPLDVGLPVDAACEGLAEPPRQPEISPSYELKETVLIGTVGKSALDVFLRVRGLDADHLRRQIESMGVENLSRERQEIYIKRFASARRLGKLQYRDDRLANEMVLAEAFEVEVAWRRHSNSLLRVFLLPVSLAATVLPVPANTARRTPFALPFPCDITHTLELESPAIPSGSFPRTELETAWLKFSRRQRSIRGQWSFNFSLKTLARSVPAQELAAYRKLLEQIWQETSFECSLPTGYNRPNRASLGELPVLRSPEPARGPLPGRNEAFQQSSLADVARATGEPSIETRANALSGAPASSSRRRRGSRRPRHDRNILPVGEGRFLGRMLLVLFAVLWLAMTAFVVVMSLRFRQH